MKVLLVNPTEPKKMKIDDTISGKNVEHLGLGYIAAVLRANDIKVKILDARIEKNAFEEIPDKIMENEFDILGISIPYQWSVVEVVEIVRKLREKGLDKKVFVGGHPPSFYYNEILKEGVIDFVCVGEGEYTVLELVKVLENNNSIKGVKGIAYIEDGEVVYNGCRELIKNLDELPFPERDYLEDMLKEVPYISIPILASRGCCWSKCTFCDVQSFYRLSSGKIWRGRTPENIVDEIEMLVKRYNHDKFTFSDDDFFGPSTTSRARIEGICREVKRRNLKIDFHFMCNVRDIEQETLLMLKEAGLTRLFLGVESGVQRVLDTFNKGVTVEDNRKAIIEVEKADIVCCCGSIFIDPYTTIDEIMENLNFWESVGKMSVGIYKDIMPFHGTPLQKELADENRLIFKDYDYLYEHTLDPDVRKLNKLVERIKEEFIRPYNEELAKLKYRVINTGFKLKLKNSSIEENVKKIYGLYVKLTDELFNKFLKSIAQDIKNIDSETFNICSIDIIENYISEYEVVSKDINEFLERVLEKSNFPRLKRNIGR